MMKRHQHGGPFRVRRARYVAFLANSTSKGTANSGVQFSASPVGDATPSLILGVLNPRMRYGWQARHFFLFSNAAIHSLARFCASAI